MNYIIIPGLKSKRKAEGLPVGEIIDASLKEFGVSLYDIRGRWRKRNVVEARSAAMYVMRKYTKMTLNQIGNCFARDHTTVMHSVKTISDLIEFDSRLKMNIENIINRARNN